MKKEKSKILKRNIYFNKIKSFINKPIIKVITGMRRVGKSYFLRQIISEIKSSEVPEENIIYIDKDSLEMDFIDDYKDLDKFIYSKIKSIKNKKKKYLFIDEIQKISNWEKAINSYLNKNIFDIYITGSNSHLLSSDLATFISGRYINFPIYSLSFNEFLDFRKNKISNLNIEDEFKNYMKFGGLPGIHSLDIDEENVSMYASSVFNTILVKDIISKFEIRNIRLLEDLTKFLCSNIGNITSAKNISDFLKSQKLSVGINTIQNHIHYLESAYLINKAARFDIQGKRFFEFKEKYFLSDLSLRHALIGYRESDINAFIENLVFLELKRLGYEVCIGALKDLEVDFIATKPNEKHYIQVSYLLSNKNIEEREFGVLLKIPDSYPKHVITLDKFWGEDYKGVNRINLIDFCMKGFKK